MKRRTNKRAREERRYLLERNEFIENQKDKQGRLFCFFCGKVISKEPDIHHLFRRDGDRLLDKKYWRIAHNFCHVHQYHSMSWRKIPWWNDYIKRIKNIPLLYEKEKERMGK